MSNPDFFIGDVRLTGHHSESELAGVSFIQGDVSGLGLTELTILCEQLVELRCGFDPGDIVWVIVLEGLLTGKLTGKKKLTVPAKMIHLDIPARYVDHYNYQVRGQSRVQLLFIQIKGPDIDDWLAQMSIKHLYRIIEGGVSVGASVMPMGLSHYIAGLQVVTEWRKSKELTGESSRLLEWILAETLYYVAYQHSHQQVAHSSNEEERVLRVIEEWINAVEQPMDVAILSRLTGLNPTRLQEVFKSEFDEPAMQFIRRVRLEKARSLVEETRQSLSIIAHATGFSNLTHFSQAFKRQFGVSPRAYRALHSANAVMLYEARGE